MRVRSDASSSFRRASSAILFAKYRGPAVSRSAKGAECDFDDVCAARREERPCARATLTPPQPTAHAARHNRRGQVRAVPTVGPRELPGGWRVWAPFGTGFPTRTREQRPPPPQPTVAATGNCLQLRSARRQRLPGRPVNAAVKAVLRVPRLPTCNAKFPNYQYQRASIYDVVQVLHRTVAQRRKCQSPTDSLTSGKGPGQPCRATCALRKRPHAATLPAVASTTRTGGAAGMLHLSAPHGCDLSG